MIFAYFAIEFEADDYGPAESYGEWVPIHPSFASTAEEAHEKLTHLIATEPDFEIPTADGFKIFPLNAETVRRVVVREG